MVLPDHFPEALQPHLQKKWNDFCNASKGVNIPIPDDSEMLKAIKRVFALSDFVADSCTRKPGLLDELIKSSDLQHSYRPERYAIVLDTLLKDVQDEKQLGQILRNIRRREMVRICWRDICGWADLLETTVDLSYFADACLDRSLTFLYEKLATTYGIPTGLDGTPQQLVIISMGKLGGMELNFSSDIDLIFAYPQSGNTTGGSTSIRNEEFFTRLCRSLVNAIGASTSEGFVFRVDLRLRPDGENGPLVMTFDNMETYYQSQGREWERYAWIKARISAGDKKAGAQLLDRLRPFVFRRYLDYGAFDSLRSMKEKIVQEIKRKKMEENIKLGPGGIREIEFFGQAFQLLRGGVIPALQERNILTVLKTLHENGFISQHVWRQLQNAYIFLRTTEHHLQEVSDQQIHLLPSDPLGKARLALSMGFDNWETFATQLAEHRKHVHHHFNGLLAIQDSHEVEDQKKKELADVWQDLRKTDFNKQVLIRAGFDEPEKIINLLEYLSNDSSTRALSSQGRKRLDKLVPIVLEAVGISQRPTLILNRIIDLIKTIERRTSYLALLLENPSTLSHLVDLSDASPWIVTFLAHHPVLLDELLDPRTLYTPPDKTELRKEIKHRLDQVTADDLEYQIEQLCIFKQVNTLRVSAADVTGALPLMRTSDHLTEIAETVLEQVLDLSWQHLVKKHGKPTCILDDRNCDRGFVVIAYGKLGGIELGYTSDLDLVFLHAGTSGQTQGGERPIDNGQFFSRLGQRVIHILTAHTRAGKIYETDMRLRPSGDAGPLVSHIGGFKEYQTKHAWTWEHQALIRARAICGDAALFQLFLKIREEVLALPRDPHQLQKDVLDMRQRLRLEAERSDPQLFDLKQDTGGIMDIEFIVQYLVLLKAHEYPELTQWTDNVRLLETLSKTSVIDSQTAQMLKISYLTYRSAVHRLGLQEKAPQIPAPEFAELRKEIEELWKHFLETEI